MMNGICRCTALTYKSIRTISSTPSRCKVVPNNVRSSSSHDWVKRHLNDPYVKKSRFHNFRCRSAFKLMEIDDKYKFLHPGLRVVDVGGAPGSWTQVLVRRLDILNVESSESKGGMVICVDLQKIEPILGAVILDKTDFMKADTQQHISSLLPGGMADVVLSDMAPKATGTKELDISMITTLVYGALKFCTKVLVENGVFLCKMWDSSNVAQMVKNMQMLFSSVKIVKPKASYMDSSEFFLVCIGFKKPESLK